MRWDRVGRIALLFVLGVVGLLYISHAVAYVKARSQFDAQHGIVVNLQRANATLVREEQALSSPAAIMRAARGLGMVVPGERSYVIIGQGSGR